MPDNNQIPQTFPEDTIIPPIPSGMVQDTSFPNPIQTITDAPPQEVNTPPKRKFGGKKMIATILGLLVLIGGIATGVVLVKQQQDIREKAGIDVPCKVCKDNKCTTVASPPNCTISFNECSSNSQCATPGCDKEGECDCTGNKSYRWFTDSVTKQCALEYDTSCVAECSVPPPTCNYTEKYCVPDHPDPATGRCGGEDNRYWCEDLIGEWGYGYITGCPCPSGYRIIGTVCINYTTCDAGIRCSLGYDDRCPGGATPTPESTPTPTPTPRATPTPTPRSTPTPPYRGCGEACNDYIHCIPSLNCPGGPGGGHCVNGLCPNDPDCVCAGTPTPTPRATPTPTPRSTPTPTPGIDAICSAVKAYDINWNLLSGAQLSALSAGSVVRFTISGTPADQIDKARFTINGVLGPEITTKKPGTNEYYVEYTIPAGVYSFTVTAQIHHLTLGWF